MSASDYVQHPDPVSKQNEDETSRASGGHSAAARELTGTSAAVSTYRADSSTVSARAADAKSSHVFSNTDSPCVAVCSTLFDEICRGCGRTASEVSNWVFLSDEEKQQVWKRIR